MAIPDELQSFVKEALTRGLTRPEVEAVLLSAGWEREQVQASLRSYADVPFPIPVPRPAPYLSAREAFLYLLLFATLYLSAFHLGQLLFQFINLAIPDPASPIYAAGPTESRRLIRWAVSTLIVAFPVFLYLSQLTGRELRSDPAKRASKVRRWLTYLTLFAAATVVIGDLIALLNDLLAGELTLRFGLKVLVVAVIAGGVFAYYLHDSQQAEAAARA